MHKKTEWFLLEYETHAKFQRYVAELNQLYLKYPALWQRDDSWEGFSWIDADNKDQSIVSYRRIAENGDELAVLINFTPVAYEDYIIGVPGEGKYVEMINSDDTRFGGSGVVNTGELKTQKFGAHGFENSLRLRVPPLGITILRQKKQRKPAKKKI